jgi:hypothetical protein
MQALKPVEQVVTQREPSHDCPGAQPRPHSPQLRGSRRRSAQYAPVMGSEQVVSSSAHDVVHMPLLQTCPAPQRTPQAPQWLRSVSSETHSGEVIPESPSATGHAIWEPGHETRHCPSTQRSVSAQRVPQAPQLAGSMATETQRPLHSR